MSDDSPRELYELKGKIVARAVKDLDHSGYDIFHIDFTDGTYLEIVEEGQAGHFTYMFTRSSR